MFWTDGQKLEINDIGQFTDGWAIGKYSNLTSTGALPQMPIPTLLIPITLYSVWLMFT